MYYTVLSFGCDELSEKHGEVITRRFGLRGHEGQCTLEQCGCLGGVCEEVCREIGLTRERVRQFKLRHFGKLRLIMDKEGLSLDDVITF